jgi:GNAT superfamily N-acetyltransferase
VSVVERIRDAELDEISALESLKRRSRSVWEADRSGPALSADVAELPVEAIRERRVRVAADGEGRPVGVSVVRANRGGVCRLEGLFVDPDSVRQGVGRLLVADVLERATRRRANSVEVIADPRAQGFYRRLGFRRAGEVTTRVGPAVRMERPC